MAGDSRRCEVIGLGASAGGVEALVAVARSLPADLPAAVLVVLHVAPTGTSVLPAILGRSGPLPAVAAQDGAPLEPGRIYIAPADAHLLVQDGVLALDRGPRENGHRPAVDPLFRSMAEAYGPRAAAVVLSGARDDGTAGLRAIKLAGGSALVQDPETALYPAMPTSAIENVAVDAVLPLHDLARALVGLAWRGPPVVQEGADMAPDEDRGPEPPPEPGPPDGDGMQFSCPECGGVLREHSEGALPRFNCHVGHRFSFESLIAAHEHGLEQALWTAVRTLEERATLLRRLGDRMTGDHLTRSAASMERQAEEAEQKAELIRRAIELFPPAVATEA